MNNQPKIAVQLYTLREQCAVDFPAVLEQVAALGYRAVELAGFHKLSAPELADCLAANGLIPAASHVSLDDLQTRFEQVLTDHATINCSTIVVPYLSADQRKNLTDWQKVALTLSELGERCAERQVRLAYHNHDFEFENLTGSETNGFEALFFSSAPRTFTSELDVYWATKAGHDPVALIERLADRCPLVHMKDMAAGTGDFAEVGQGILPWPAILHAARRSGVEWLIVEQDVCPRDPMECVRVSFDNLVEMMRTS